MEICLNCPQCGAEVNMEEDASVFRCEYCTTTLKPIGRKEVQSFFISPNDTKETVGQALENVLSRKIGFFKKKDSFLCYAPYWRVHGMLFQWTFGRKLTEKEGKKYFNDFKELRAVNYDRTFPAFHYSQWEVSALGLKPQFLKMRPFNRNQMGDDALIIESEVTHQEAVNMARKIPSSLIDFGKTKREINLTKSGLIGEVYSLVYYPFYCFIMQRGNQETIMIVDAVSHKLVKGNIPLYDLTDEARELHIPYQPINFIPFKCPYCNWDLPFRPYCWIHLCSTCGKAWQEAGGTFDEVPYTLCSKEEALPTDLQYLPFWQLEVKIVAPEREYSNLKDFYELYPLHRVMDKKRLLKRNIYFYIPAFRTNNINAVDKLARRLTRVQPTFNAIEPDPDQKFKYADVRLSQHEALEMSRLLLYSLTSKGLSKTHKILDSVKLDAKKTRLLWLPFVEHGIFFKELFTDFLIEKKSLTDLA